MDMSKISHLFQQNSPFRAKDLYGGANKILQLKNAPNNILSQISNKTILQQQDRTEMEAAANIQKMKMDTYTKTESSDELEEMPEEVLAYYLQVSKFYAKSSGDQEQDLLAFKERLQGMDQTIQGYQDVIDGKVALPEDLKVEDVINSLSEAKQTREQFWQDGVAHLNKWSDYWLKSDTFDHHSNRVLGGNKFADMDLSNWKLDPSTSSVYSEIDRALEATQGVTEELNRCVARVYNILDERGFGDEYKQYLKSWRKERSSAFDDIEATSIQQMILDNLESVPLQKVQNSDI